MHASMCASFLFPPSDLTEQRISGFEELLLLWEWVGPDLLDLIIGIRAARFMGAANGIGRPSWRSFLRETSET